jgi:hypothetical protein
MTFVHIVVGIVMLPILISSAQSRRIRSVSLDHNVRQSRDRWNNTLQGSFAFPRSPPQWDIIFIISGSPEKIFMETSPNTQNSYHAIATIGRHMKWWVIASCHFMHKWKQVNPKTITSCPPKRAGHVKRLFHNSVPTVTCCEIFYFLVLGIHSNLGLEVVGLGFRV